MSYVVRITLIESNGAEGAASKGGTIHADAQYEYNTLELAREAEQVACNAATGMKPRRSKATSDESWIDHPDRSDAADV
jgi:hypothetical protein